MLTLQGVESHNTHTLGVAAVVSAAGRFLFWVGGEIAIHIHNFFRIQSCPSGCQIKTRENSRDKKRYIHTFSRVFVRKRLPWLGFERDAQSTTLHAHPYC